MFFQNLKILLGVMPSIRFAECTQCRNCSAEKNRECPKCGASFPEHCVIRTFTAQDIPEDRVELFVTCPGCSRSLPVGVLTCSACGATYSREYASQSAQANVRVSQAFVNAEKIEALRPGAFLMLAVAAGVTAGVFVLSQPLVGLFLLVPLLLAIFELLRIRQWFRWFGSFESEHEDFVSSRRKVDDALRLWRGVVVALAALVVLLLLLWMI